MSGGRSIEAVQANLEVALGEAFQSLLRSGINFSDTCALVRGTSDNFLRRQQTVHEQGGTTLILPPGARGIGSRQASSSGTSANPLKFTCNTALIENTTVSSPRVFELPSAAMNVEDSGNSNNAAASTAVFSEECLIEFETSDAPTGTAVGTLSIAELLATKGEAHAGGAGKKCTLVFESVENLTCEAFYVGIAPNRQQHLTKSGVGWIAATAAGSSGFFAADKSLERDEPVTHSHQRDGGALSFDCSDCLILSATVDDFAAAASNGGGKFSLSLTLVKGRGASDNNRDVAVFTRTATFHTGRCLNWFPTCMVEAGGASIRVRSITSASAMLTAQSSSSVGEAVAGAQSASRSQSEGEFFAGGERQATYEFVKNEFCMIGQGGTHVSIERTPEKGQVTIECENYGGLARPFAMLVDPDAATHFSYRVFRELLEEAAGPSDSGSAVVSVADHVHFGYLVGSFAQVRSRKLCSVTSPLSRNFFLCATVADQEVQVSLNEANVPKGNAVELVPQGAGGAEKVVTSSSPTGTTTKCVRVPLPNGAAACSLRCRKSEEGTAIGLCVSSGDGESLAESTVALIKTQDAAAASALLGSMRFGVATEGHPVTVVRSENANQ